MEGFAPLVLEERPVGEMRARAARFYDLMRRRRTVRDFSNREIPRDIIENALLTAGSAPSGAHRQPWHFVVVTDPGKKAAIREAAEHEERAFYGRRAPKEWLEALAPLGTDANKPFLTTAPVLIGVFLRRFSFVEDGGSRKRVKNYYIRVGRHRHWSTHRRAAQRGPRDADAYAQPDAVPEQVARAPAGRAPVCAGRYGLSGIGRAGSRTGTLWTGGTGDVCLTPLQVLPPAEGISGPKRHGPFQGSVEVKLLLWIFRRQGEVANWNHFHIERPPKAGDVLIVGINGGLTVNPGGCNDLPVEL